VSHPISVVLLEDHEVVQLGLREMFSDGKRVQIIGTADTGEDGLELIDKLLPEVAVVDFGLPGMSGADVCARLARSHPKIPALILTAFLGDTIVHTAIASGAKGYVYKEAKADELAEAIQTVARGDFYADKRVVGRVVNMVKKRRSTPEEPILSQRETELLRLVARGLANKEIAKEMYITLNTVKTYLRRILFKLNCHSRAEAAAKAAKWGLI
jgi:DNA-binding NarL/FixJ family response regulator